MQETEKVSAEEAAKRLTAILWRGQPVMVETGYMAGTGRVQGILPQGFIHSVQPNGAELVKVPRPADWSFAGKCWTVSCWEQEGVIQHDN